MILALYVSLILFHFVLLSFCASQEINDVMIMMIFEQIFVKTNFYKCNVLTHPCIVMFVVFFCAVAILDSAVSLHIFFSRADND